jgi:hypothetical protein
VAFFSNPNYYLFKLKLIIMKSNLYFGCDSAAEVQQRFDELSKVFNNQDEMLQVIKAEYSTLMSVLNPIKPVEAIKEKATVSEKIAELQGKINNPEGLHFEVCGTWLWVTGKTYQVKDLLKSLHFRYSSQKLAWYYRQEEYRSSNQEPIPLEMIREKFGSQQVALQ